MQWDLSGHFINLPNNGISILYLESTCILSGLILDLYSVLFKRIIIASELSDINVRSIVKFVLPERRLPY